MPTREIPRTDWVAFFRRFLRVHRGWACELAITATNPALRVETRGLPLADVRVEATPTRLVVVVGDRHGAHAAHVLASPRRIWLQQSEAGVDETVEIESGEARTVIAFVPAG